MLFCMAETKRIDVLIENIIFTMGVR
jgi:hypothetical protein